MSLQAVHHTYASVMQQNLGLGATAKILATHGFGKDAQRMYALQSSTLELAKKQEAIANDDDEDDDDDDCFNVPSSVAQPAEPQWVPLPLANQGPAAVALKLLTDAKCTE